MRVGDARDLGALGLGPESVDCIVTSPPYWHLKKYAEGDDREIGHSQTKEDYLSAVGVVFGQCLELTKPTGVMWVVIDTLRDVSRRPGLGEMIPLPFELVTVARDKGWRFQDIAIWKKNKTLPYSGTGKLRNLIEYVLFFTKEGTFKHRPYRCATRHLPGAEWLAGWPERYHPLGKRPDNVWEVDIDTQGMWDHSAGVHACPFPQDLVARCIDLTTDKGDVVLDPFAGVGTVPAQAIAMGRRGYGLELNPENVQMFNDRILSEFQAAWEAQAEVRRLSREDQLNEALQILRLRLLKAGKELKRWCERLARANPNGHPAALIESVLVLEPEDLVSYVNIDEGKVGRPPARLVLIGPITDSDRAALVGLAEEAALVPPFTTFGLDLSVDACSAEQLDQAYSGQPLLEFGQSRHGAYTTQIDRRLFAVLPQFLTTVNLGGAIQGSRMSPLEEARQMAERQVLQKELASGSSISEIARALGESQAEVHRLLVRHGLREQPRSFAIALPNQLALES
jgi:DNA modification methylase